MLDNLRVNEHCIAVIGGDLRQIHLAIMLSKKGFPVTIYGNDDTSYTLSKIDSEYMGKHIRKAESFTSAIKQNDIIIAPIPLSKDGIHITTNQMFESIMISSFLDLLTHKPMVFAGTLNNSVSSFFLEHEIPFCDLMKLDTVAITNAIATAEGTILEAIKRSTINLHHSSALVLGFGRCAKILALKLKGLDVSVTVAARKSEALAYANSYGFHTLTLSEAIEDLSRYDYIFNTVPSRILERNSLLTANPDVTIIDIASAPGGVDMYATHDLNLNASLCLGLPGLYSPKTSADILLHVILELLDTPYHTEDGKEDE